MKCATVFAADGLFQTLELRSPNEEQGGMFGISVSGAGDVNNDGYDDLIVGAAFEDPGTSPSAAGRGYVFDGLTGDTLFTLVSPNEESNGRFGASVSGIGDVNGDGHDDVIVGAFLEDPDTSPEGAGRAYVFSGMTGSLLYTLTSPNESSFGSFGSSVSEAGDVDNDGLPDIIVGAISEEAGGGTGAGRAHVFNGENGTLIYTLVSPNTQGNGSFGNWVSSAGDVNNDGYDDVIVGAFWEEPPPSPFAAGRSYVFSGQTGTLIYELQSPNEVSDGNFGGTVACAGDVNNDGFDDVVVGARGENALSAGDGRAYVFSGQTGALLHTLVSPNPEINGLFGSGSGAGDINSDGFDDLVVGAGGENGSAGRAYLFSGQSGDTLGTLVSPNSAPLGFFGATVSPAGDVNNDGEIDIILPASREEPGGSPLDAGRAYVFHLPITSDVTYGQEPLTSGFLLGQNYPNPFNPSTTIVYEVERRQPAALRVYDVLGQEVTTLFNGVVSPGRYSVTWDARTMSDGVYFYRLHTGDGVQTKRMILIR